MDVEGTLRYTNFIIVWITGEFDTVHSLGGAVLNVGPFRRWAKFRTTESRAAGGAVFSCSRRQGASFVSTSRSAFNTIVTARMSLPSTLIRCPLRTKPSVEVKHLRTCDDEGPKRPIETQCCFLAEIPAGAETKEWEAPPVPFSPKPKDWIRLLFPRFGAS
jgi:hypothetical protein